MAVTVEGSGTKTGGSVGTEYTLHGPDTDRKMFVYQVDLGAYVAGDAGEQIQRMKAKSAGSEKLVDLQPWGEALSEVVQALVALPSPHSASFLYKQTRGAAWRDVPWNVCSLGAITLETNDGDSQTAVIATKHALKAVSAAKTYALIVDAANLASGDRVELSCEAKVLSGGAEQLIVLGEFCNVQREPIKVAPPIVVPYSATFYLKQTAGTGRAFDYAVVSW